MVDRTASLRWEEPGLPCTLMPQYSRSLPRAVSALGTKPTCYSLQPHSSTSSLWDTFLGLEKLLVRFIATSGSGTKTLHQLQTQAPCLPELLIALGVTVTPSYSLSLVGTHKASLAIPVAGGSWGPWRPVVLTLTPASPGSLPPTPSL